MNSGELQQELFNAIRGRIGKTGSPADEIAGLLNISTDSAYRRMRGEITVPFHELYILCRHFRISLDGIMKNDTGAINFHGKFIDKNYSFREYLQNVLSNMGYMNSFKNKQFYYMCKDLPMFHHFHERDIAAFKWFFWLRTYFEFPEFENKKFRFEDHPDEIHELEQKVLDVYNEIPSVEMWNLETMNIFFRQIDFYRAGKVFGSDDDVYRLYESIEKLWDHLEEQAALGYKFRMNDPDKKAIAPLKMYFNEVLLGDNNMMVELDGNRFSYVSHTTINFMHTTDKGFNDNMYNHIQNQMKRSTLISEVSEKERSRFFRIIRDKILRRKQAL